MYLWILTTYSEQNLGRTQLSAVRCESPIILLVGANIKKAVEIVTINREMKPKNFSGKFNTIREAQQHWYKWTLKVCTNYERVGLHFKISATTHFAFM